MKLRRTLALVIILALLLALTPGIQAADAISRLTVTIWGDPASSRGFTWYTGSARTASDVEVQAEGGAAVLTFSGRSGASSNDASVRWHKAEATGLTSNTVYRFRVGDADANLWSSWGTFRTASAARTAGSDGLTFIALTDTQAASTRDADISANTLAVALRTAPEAVFVIHSGDVVDSGLDESQWRITLDAAYASLLHTTLVPAAGNHERSGSAFWEHFNVSAPAGSDTKSGAYYSFTWGPLHVVTLNTNEASGDIVFMSDAQLEWLRADITAARQKGALRIVVNVHKGPYSLGAYAVDSTVTGRSGLRTKLAPILESLGVDLVLEGHDHFASRTLPLRDGKPVRLGTTYLNTATAGVKRYSRHKEVPAAVLALFDYISGTAATYTRYQNFAVVTVDSRGNMSGVLYEIDQQKDASAPYIVDRFSLPTPVSRFGVLPFDDVADSDAFAPALERVYAAHIMAGVSATAFEPHSTVNRATLVTLLHRLAGEPRGTGAAFSDVPAGRWYADAVRWASGAGHVLGYSDGRFGPLDTIPREQLAVVLFRYAGGSASGRDLDGYSDGAAVSGWAREAMAWALDAGVLTPVGGKLMPRGGVSRAEAAIAMASMLGMGSKTN